MAIIFTLQETLDSRQVSRNKLSVEGKLRLATLYEMAHNQSKAIKLETLDTILITLNRLCEEAGTEPVDITDIIKFQYPPKNT